ncbi:DASS family sodium-coupled anion symporter [Croceicoccus ponticola]|uniref:DASS family sodium-coupled anion symporter n=1 Tax=Croceicoccus ponticola TaxID=2217664 RepID=A0A437GUR2_9SPHN|nr:DASS family sodium-coupled anion symporter [Croceicoccus ponticola]RVQ65300.1 DASS family sodium-coupled anion symporter [Croceicoccus ponticola]
MSGARIGFWLGLALMAATIIAPPPAGMTAMAWHTAGLVMWMASWWMSHAIPLSATAMLPFVVLPLASVATAKDVASSYYSPIIFLILGGAMLALAIERTGLHRRLARALVRLGGHSSFSMLLAFMVATAVLSMLISNTSAALIMIPMAIAVIAAGSGSARLGDGGMPDEPVQHGIAGALPIGIAFAATIGGFGTIVGTPTNAIAVALLDEMLGVKISFARWMAFGLPLVAIALPIAALLIARVQRLSTDRFDVDAARAALVCEPAWSSPQKRLSVVIVLTFIGWLAAPFVGDALPEDSLTDGTVAVIAALILFVLPDGTGRAMLNWKEANRAPWDVLLLFGGGLALAGGMAASGLAEWLGQMLLPLEAVPLFLVAMAICALVILITEFASNVATGSAVIPVVAGLIAALGVDPILLAMPAAIAASWGFMLPAGTGPNAIAWASGHVALPAMIRSGLLLDVAGVILLPGVIWLVVLAF